MQNQIEAADGAAISNSNVRFFRHNLLLHKITVLRDKDCSSQKFRQLLKECGALMMGEATRQLPLSRITRVETPLETMEGALAIDNRKIVVVPILRAGLPFAEGAMDVVPSAAMGHIGIHRIPIGSGFEAVDYLVKLPDVEDRLFFLLDPLVGTGVTAHRAISLLKQNGVPDNKIIFVALLCASQGVTLVSRAFPEVNILAAVEDPELGPDGYIRPGLGDAGDRAFGTA